MPEEQSVSFDVYRLDLHNKCVWRGKQVLHLTSKAFTVLCYLVEHAGQLVTKDELFQTAWPDTVVSDAALTICIGEIRKVLRDTARAPRFIATVHRRGYRFLARVVRHPQAGASYQTPVVMSPEGAPNPWHLATPLVGRDTELARLRGWLAQAQRGIRQVIFVTGEGGIGKTTVVDAFLATMAREASLAVAWGQCMVHYGAGEAYLPVLDALGRLCRTSGQARLLALLGQYAPTWLVQLPALLSTADLEALQRRVLGATRERMLRELAEALEAMTIEQPVVLVLEDLHWSDHATLDLITWLARRREPARLLLLGTYRPVDVIMHGHPLKAVKQDLELHRQCVELRLEGLGETAVAAYLAARFPGSALPHELVCMLHQRTEGQPLLLVQVVDAWVQHGWVVEVAGQWVVQAGLAELETGVPESVRQMIVQQLDGCSAEAQRVLEAASAVGVVFSTAAVAAGVEAAAGDVEEQCEALVRRGQFLEACGVEEWPDGTIAGRYRFVHALYQQVVYDRLPVGRQLALHRRLGTRLEAGYGVQASEQAAVLAVHFERGRDAARAVHYLQQAAVNALGRYAYQEATTHLRRALEQLATLPETTTRARQEVAVLTALGPALIATTDQAAPEVGCLYRHAWELCQQVGDPQQLCVVLRGLCRFHSGQGEYQQALELGRQLLTVAQHAHDPALLPEAYLAIGFAAFLLGELATARAHLEQGRALYAPQQHPTHVMRSGQDPGVQCLAYGALTLWLLGYPDQAQQRLQEAFTLAQALEHPFSLVNVQVLAAQLYHCRREGAQVAAQAEAAVALAQVQGFRQREVEGAILWGWALAAQGRGAGQIRQEVETWQTTGAGRVRPYWQAVLADTSSLLGQVAEALTLVAEALEGTGPGKRQHFYVAELYRLQGELVLQSSVEQSGVQTLDSRLGALDAETCFQQALEIARQQQAKALELRAATSLSRLWQRQGERAAAHALLAPIYGWFTEGFDTADLQEAQALLAELA